MYDPPSRSEQLAAVAAFLREQLMPRLDGQLAFHVRVSANLLDIVAREQRLGPVAEAGELQRLAALLGHGGELDAQNRELCARLEAGAMDLATPGLAEHLWRVAFDKLAVDQPRYETYVRLTEPD